MPRMTQAEYQAFQARHHQFRPGTKEYAESETKERVIHDQIMDVCRGRGWIALHSRMDTVTSRPCGEWDFTLLADRGRVFFFEVKTATGKLRPEQAGMIAWANKLGHTVHVVRSLEEFCELVSAKKICHEV